MILRRIYIKNFRSIREALLDVGPQMAIVGGNGAGKSSVLRAIDRFYSQSSSIESDDFFGRKFDEPIEIALTFVDLNEVEQEMFASRYHSEEMTVVRVFDPGGGKSSGRYYGMTRQHAAFQAVRRIDGAAAQRDAYNALRTSNVQYESLPAVSRASQIADAFLEWENNNVDQCTLLRDDGQFFGFTNVGRGALQKATSFVFIPAVRDASADALDTRGAVVQRLLELVVRSAIQRRSDIREFQSKISGEYRQLVDPEKLTELGGLSEELTSTLQSYYRETSVVLKWKQADDFQVPLPAADVLLDDDGFEGPVDRKGHGLQRAFILTLLQHLAKATSADTAMQAVEVAGSDVSSGDSGEEDEHRAERYTLPGLILAIEEPELYQHPTKQRHFAKVLRQLSSGELPGVARQTQVLFATHSALFVSLDEFSDIRLARRWKAASGDCKECNLSFSNLEKVARRVEGALGLGRGSYSEELLRAKLHTLRSEVAEGFFADAVVLVEGVSDRAAIVAAAALRKIDLEALGIAVLPVDGKQNLIRPFLIFDELDIPTFIVFDCDRKGSGVVEPKDISLNHALQRMMGTKDGNMVDAGTLCSNNHACFDTTMEKVVRAEIGETIYVEELSKIKAEFGIDQNSDAIKVPVVMRQLLQRASERGAVCRSLEGIVETIAKRRVADSGFASGLDGEGRFDAPATEAIAHATE